jgi:hypothetical protein
LYGHNHCAGKAETTTGAEGVEERKKETAGRKKEGEKGGGVAVEGPAEADGAARAAASASYEKLLGHRSARKLLFSGRVSVAVTGAVAAEDAAGAADRASGGLVFPRYSEPSSTDYLHHSRKWRRKAAAAIVVVDGGGGARKGGSPERSLSSVPPPPPPPPPQCVPPADDLLGGRRRLEPRELPNV